MGILKLGGEHLSLKNNWDRRTSSLSALPSTVGATSGSREPTTLRRRLLQFRPATRAMLKRRVGISRRAAQAPRERFLIKTRLRLYGLCVMGLLVTTVEMSAVNGTKRHRIRSSSLTRSHLGMGATREVRRSHLEGMCALRVASDDRSRWCRSWRRAVRVGYMLIGCRKFSGAGRACRAEVRECDDHVPSCTCRGHVSPF